MHRQLFLATARVCIALVAALALAACATHPDATPTYLAVDRGLHWQCHDSPDPGICVQQRYLALQERHRRVLLQNECAVTRGWRTRDHDSLQCRTAPAPQTLTCRSLLGVLTCTLDDDPPTAVDSRTLASGPSH
jgi:hypothetical protein